MSNEKENNEQREKTEYVKNHAIAGAETEIVQRYGAAAKEHFVVYSGVDNETGEELKKGLEKISEAKVHPDYEKQNLKQQAGFAAENKYAARQNAENIINRNGNHVHNTDVKGSGKYNQLFDHIITDKDGNIIAQEQMKFVGNSPEAALNKLASKKFQKYFDAEATITVPKDYYEGIKEAANKKIEKLKEKLASGKVPSDKETYIKKQIEKYEKIKSSIKDSGITNDEAMFARLHPKLSTAQDIAKISHSAGVQGASIGAGIAGISSMIQNLVAYAKGEKTAEEAAKSVALATGNGAAMGYASAFAGAAIKGAMQNSKREITRAISKTSFPAQIVSITMEVSNTMQLYLSGEIDGVECLSMIGEQGCGMLSSSLFATVGGVAGGAIAGPAGIAVGGMIGGMIGYVFNNAFYGLLKDSLTEAKFAHEQRLQIEAECEEAINLAKEYQEEIQKITQKYFSEYLSVFNSSFDLMKQAIESDDIDLFIKGNQDIQNQLGYKSQFSNFNEFDELMKSSDSLKL